MCRSEMQDLSCSTVVPCDAHKVAAFAKKKKFYGGVAGHSGVQIGTRKSLGCTFIPSNSRRFVAVHGITAPPRDVWNSKSL